MSANNFLRKAKPGNLQETQAQLSKLIRSKSEPLDELKDKKLLGEIERARKEYAEGKAVPAERLFKKWASRWLMKSSFPVSGFYADPQMPQ